MKIDNEQFEVDLLYYVRGQNSITECLTGICAEYGNTDAVRDLAKRKLFAWYAQKLIHFANKDFSDEVPLGEFFNHADSYLDTSWNGY